MAATAAEQGGPSPTGAGVSFHARTEGAIIDIMMVTIRCRLDGFGRKGGRTDLTGFNRILLFRPCQGTAWTLQKHIFSRDFDRILTD